MKQLGGEIRLEDSLEETVFVLEFPKREHCD